MKYFVSGFYQRFMPPVKNVNNFNVARSFPFSFRDFYNFLIWKGSQVLRPRSHVILTR